MVLPNLVALLASASSAQFLPPPPPPPLVTPSLLQEANKAVIAGNEAIQANQTLRTDPTTWLVPVRAVMPPLAIRPQTLPLDRLRILKAAQAKLRGRMVGESAKLLVNAISAAVSGAARVTWQGDSGAWQEGPPEPLRREILSVAYSYMDLQRQIDELQGSREMAEALYRQRMTTLEAPPPPKPIAQLPIPPLLGSAPDRRFYHDEPAPQMTTARDCTPVVVKTYQWVLVQKTIAYDERNGPTYVWNYEKVESTGTALPDGCN